MIIKVWFVISIIYVIVLFINNCSLTYKCSYYKQKLINRDVDISSAESFWSFIGTGR